MEPKIVVSDVFKKYGNNIIFEGVSVNIEPNKITALVAPNGKGKTTFISMVCGIVLPDKGSLNYVGLKLNEDICIILAGEKNLYMKNTVKENIFYFSVLQGLTPKEIKRRITEYSEEFPIFKEVKNKLVEELSYGQKRLISIFCAVITEAKCIIIDEATEGLDMEYSHLLANILTKIKKDRIILLASHDYDFVSDVADNIFYISDRKILEEENIKNSESIRNRYKHIYNIYGEEK